MLERSYSYATLRYVHDPLSGEYVNVGVVLIAPAIGASPAIILGRTSHKIGRIRAMFPDLDRSSHIDAMHMADRALRRACTKFNKSDLFDCTLEPMTVLKAVLPVDDSSLQWSQIGSGITKDLEKTFERLFLRFVARYEKHTHQRRSDEDVWRPVRALLEEREVSIDLEAKTIATSDDSIEFKHAWKNGVWHMYEPISLDLADADGIMQKVHRWLGNLTSVQDANEQFVPYFILGGPTDSRLDGVYEKAKRVLAKSPIHVQVFEEQHIGLLVDRIEADIELHRRAGKLHH